jgi:hypothetical protein
MHKWAMPGVIVGRAPVLCHWAASGFSPFAFYLFLYFLNIFKSLQIKKFV